MEITEHQASILRAAADGKKLQAMEMDTDFPANWFEITSLDNLLLFIVAPDRYVVRIKPDVIIVNGIEVPAPEKGELREGAIYWMADASEVNGRSMGIYWHGGDADKRWLRYGIVHTSADAAEAHGKAMRAHKPG